MKILIAGIEQIKKDEHYMDDKGWSFSKAFENLGHTVESFFYKKKGRLSVLEKNKHIKSVWHMHMNRKLVEAVRTTRPDILMVLKGETILPETLRTIRTKTDTTIINVFPDNPLYMGKFEAIEPCHYFFVKDTYVLASLHKAGLRNVHYLPQCTDPDVHKPMDLTANEQSLYVADVSLIGTMYPYRLKFIEELLELKPALWGRGWATSSNKKITGLYRAKNIRGSAKAKAISASNISLNLHHPLNDIQGVNRRTYDIAACGGFQLADYKSNMEDLFKVNEEIICFKDMEELKKLIPYYLERPDERAMIAQAAFKRVVRDHTYVSRAKQILDVAGIAG